MFTLSPHKKIAERCIVEELHLKQGGWKRRRPCREDKNIKDTSHSNFVAKNHKSKVQPRFINDMYFACCTESFANNTTFALCTPQSIKH
jgi:hypothetical protein